MRSFYRKHKWPIWVIGFFLAVIMIAGASGTPPHASTTNTANISQAFQAASGTPSSGADLENSNVSSSRVVATNTATTSNVVQASPTTTSIENNDAAPSEASATVAPATTSETQASSQTLSNDNYYTNSDGNQVHSPAYTSSGAAPAGATAQCVDGTYSFSQHRSGTCSHHGGVATWLQ